MNPRFSLRQLEIFAAVMRHGRIRAAAEHLHLSQAAVSQAISELGDALGVTLFERRGRTLVATPAARRLLELSHGPRQELATLAERLRGDQAAPLEGSVHISASSTIARYLLPEALAALVLAYPHLRPRLSSGNTADVTRRVLEGQADIGFIEGPASHEALHIRRWRTDQLQIIAPPDGPTHIDADTLAAHRWVMREAGSGTRVVFEQHLTLAGIAVPTAHLVVDDAGAQVRAVAAGAGLACVSRAAAEAAVAAGQIRLLNLAGLVFERPLYSIRHGEAVRAGLAERLLAALDTREPAP